MCFWKKTCSLKSGTPCAKELETFVQETALNGTHVVVLPCWAEKEAEDQVEDLKSHAGEMLRILQDCAKSTEAYCVVIAGSGAVAEACFSSLASMLRSAQCEGSVQVQAWFQTRTAGCPCDLCFCSPRSLPFLQWIHHKYDLCFCSPGHLPFLQWIYHNLRATAHATTLNFGGKKEALVGRCCFCLRIGEASHVSCATGRKNNQAGATTRTNKSRKKHEKAR